MKCWQKFEQRRVLEHWPKQWLSTARRWLSTGASIQKTISGFGTVPVDRQGFLVTPLVGHETDQVKTPQTGIT
ncbi:hypothetical protein Taro_052191 [Colocasia esculenta]|uniref:Uncharacterized protein n=1 Tax=Colocasia esculenta TaxID=4460 RepID=A0A843XIZ8_COLES|nr:hypothetical protein [Colocasia esculenta]